MSELCVYYVDFCEEALVGSNGQGRTFQGRALAVLGLTMVLVAGCGQAEPDESATVESERTGDRGETDDEAPDEGNDETPDAEADETAGAGADEDSSTQGDAGDEGTEEPSSDPAESDVATDDRCPSVDWREQEGAFEGSLDPVPDAGGDPGEWIIDEHGPVAVAVPGTWVPSAENERQPQVWGYDVPVGDDTEGGLFITGICGAPILGADGDPLDVDDAVQSAGLGTVLGDPNAVMEGPADYTAVWHDVFDGLMSMRYDFVEIDEDMVVVLISQAVEPHVDALEGEQDTIDAVVESVGQAGHVDCPPAATGCVDERG